MSEDKTKAPTESEQEHTEGHRQAGMRLVRRAAIRGNGVCGASVAMDALARSMGMRTPIDYADEDDGGEW